MFFCLHVLKHQSFLCWLMAATCTRLVWAAVISCLSWAAVISFPSWAVVLSCLSSGALKSSWLIHNIWLAKNESTSNWKKSWWLFSLKLISNQWICYVCWENLEWLKVKIFVRCFLIFILEFSRMLENTDIRTNEVIRCCRFTSRNIF